MQINLSELIQFLLNEQDDHGLRSIQTCFEDYLYANSSIVLEEPTASFIDVTSLSITLDRNIALDFLMDTQKSQSRIPFQGKLLTDMKSAQSVGLNKSEYDLDEIDEAPESTETSSEAKEQSECPTPTLRFSPSVDKLRPRSHKNSF